MTLQKNIYRFLIISLFLITYPGFTQENDSHYVFLGNENIPPMIYNENSKTVGIVVDLVSALAESVGLDIEIIAQDWSEAQTLLQSGDADALLQINWSKERDPFFDFSDELLVSEFCIFRNINRTEIRNISSLFGLTVGVEPNGYPRDFLRIYPQINVEIIETWERGFSLVNKGEIDAIIVDRMVGEYNLMKHKIGGIIVINKPVMTSSSSIAVKKGNTELLDKINQGLSQINQNGQRKEILSDWSSVETVYITRESYQLFLSAIVILLLVIVFFLIFIIYIIRADKIALKESEYFFKESQVAAVIGSYQSEFYPNDIWRTSEVCDEIFGIDDTYEKTVHGWSELLHPDFAEVMISYVTDDVIGRGIPFNKDYMIIRHSDGETRWVHGLGKIIKDETGRTTGLLGTVQDITDRKNTELSLQESEDKFRALFELSPIGMAMIDHETGEFLEVNNAVLQPIGYTKEEFIAMSFWDITPLQYEKQEADQIDDLNKTGRFGPNDKEYIRKDGSRYPIRISGFLMTNPNGRKVVWGIIEDLTEIKRIEEDKLRLQEKLAHSKNMDSIGRLAGGVAHDFNNLLSGIMGSAELLKLSIPQLTEEDLQYIDNIINGSIRGADLTAKLLSFGRKGRRSSSTVDIHSILDETVEILKSTIDKKISIIIAENADHHKIVGDNSSLYNGIMNLCINASQAMTERGQIMISTKNTTLSQSYCKASVYNIEPGMYCEIEISDTGMGIPEENLKKIFEPFFTTKELGKGTGLGLSAVYGTIQDHHGEIHVQSELGAGTVFRILLPCSDHLQSHV